MVSCGVSSPSRAVLMRLWSTWAGERASVKSRPATASCSTAAGSWPATSTVPEQPFQSAVRGVGGQRGPVVGAQDARRR